MESFLKLKALRIDAGYSTQKDFVESTDGGISLSQYSNYERGDYHQVPKLSTIKILAESLGVSEVKLAFLFLEHLNLRS